MEGPKSVKVRSKRITLVLRETVDLNMEAYAQLKGIHKHEAVNVALTDFLLRQGLQPDKVPEITISYKK
jgi:hypothetical protein